MLPSRTLNGHLEGASCLELSADQTRLYSGGLDKTVRIWDLVASKELHRFSHSSQVFALGVSTDDHFVVAGYVFLLSPRDEPDSSDRTNSLSVCSRLESSDIEHITLKEPSFPRQTVRRHSNCVLSVKFAPSKKWFLSTGKDGLVVGWKNPTCAPLFEEKEGASILCTEISACGNYVVTGSGDCRATLYSTI